MFVYFGHYLTEIDSTQPDTIECFNCKSIGKMKVRRYAKAFHLFYLPIVPYGFIDEVKCTQCGRELGYHEMNQENKARYQRFRLSKLAPWWHYIGVFLILGAIARSLIVGQFHKHEMLATAPEIEVGWIIEFKIEGGDYSAFKVREAKEEIFHIQYNYYEFRDKSDLVSVMADSYFAGEKEIIPLPNLLELIEEGTIVDIVEPENQED